MMLGLQGFNNNILFAESASKFLPKLKELLDRKKFENIHTKRENPYFLNPKAYKRLMQIWDKGTYILLRKNPEDDIITDREVIYPMDEPLKVIIAGKSQIVKNVWETINPCPVCGAESYVQLTKDDLSNIFPTCICFCHKCTYEETFDIEVKPSFSEMELARDKNTSPIWREIQGSVPVRYALEDIDLIALSSDEGGFFEEFIDGRIPKYPDINSILNSEEMTSFPSKNYYESSVKLIYKEFRYYFDILFADIVDILQFRKDDNYIGDSSSSLRQKIKETNDLE